MEHYTSYVRNILDNFSYPAEAAEAFTRIEKRLDEQKDFGEKFDRAVESYMIKQEISLKQAVEQTEALAAEYGEHRYTMDFILILNCTEILRMNYARSGLSDELFMAGVDDLRCKLMECIECEGVPGTFVADWNDGFLKMNRFAYGRFQYEKTVFNRGIDFVTKCGRVIKDGDTLINFHIPSSGIPMTDEVRLDSYKKAYEAYKGLFPDGRVVFCCNSWLLYPRHREFLPEKSNILRFLDDFEIVDWREKDGFSYDWRIFGRYAGLPYDKLPRDTSLRKAYADWLSDGNPTGDAYGVFVFDGNKILK